MGTSWSIIIFLYNEQGNVERAIQGVEEVMHAIAPGNFEIIVVNDGSTDQSEEIILKTIQDKAYFNYQKHESNKGIGISLRRGYALAKNEHVCAVPGDCQFNFKELMLCPSFNEKQFVSFYRRRTGYNLYRMFLNHFNRFVNRLFLGLKMNDVNWIKVYKKSQLDHLNLEVESSLVESEICAKLFIRDINCIEMESEYLDRLQDESKGGALKTVKQAASDLVKLIRVINKFKRGING
jgi:glycosyltransferase involved in cell wall biosynthesis